MHGWGHTYILVTYLFTQQWSTAAFVVKLIQVDTNYRYTVSARGRPVTRSPGKTVRRRGIEVTASSRTLR